MITIKKVTTDKSGLLGWEVWVCGKLYLVWADQSVMKGLRCTGENNSGFCPAVGDTMAHTDVFALEEPDDDEG